MHAARPDARSERARSVPSGPKVPLGAPPLLLLTARTSAQGKRLLRPAPPTTQYRGERRSLPQGGAGAGGACAAEGRPWQRERAAGPGAPTSTRPTGGEADKFLPAVLVKPPSLKPQPGAHPCARRSGASRDGSLEASPASGRRRARAPIGRRVPGLPSLSACAQPDAGETPSGPQPRAGSTAQVTGLGPPDLLRPLPLRLLTARPGRSSALPGKHWETRMSTPRPDGLGRRESENDWVAGDGA